MAGRRRLLAAAAGLAVSAAALWLTLRGKDAGAVLEAIGAVDLRHLGAYFAVLLAIHLVRTVRWGLLLAPAARVSFGRLNAVAAVGFMALVLLPFRLGELARPVLVAEPGKLRASTALSSIVAERAGDGLVMGLVLVAVLLGVPDSAPGVALLRTAGTAASLLFLGVVAFLFLAHRNRELAVRIAAGAAGLLSRRAAERASGTIDRFLRGLDLVKGRGQVAGFMALTALFWGLNAFGIGLLAQGFGFALGPMEATAVLGALVVAAMIPAGPGMVGTFQGGVLLGLALFLPRDVLATRGTAYANVLWGAQIGQQVALGAAFLFSRHVRLDALVAAVREPAFRD